jgi:hypothetical protein
VNEVRVLVTGGRGYRHAWRVFEELGRVLEEDCEGVLARLCVVQGGASGADAHAQEWARSQGVCSVTFEANWTKLGDVAGPIRNRWMFKFMPIDIVLAFPGGTGTQGCVREARRMGVDVREIT